MLSAEIIVTTLGIVAETSLVNQLAVLAGIGLLMTVGVYGLVARIVKLDDAWIYLEQCAGDCRHGCSGASAPGCWRPRRA